MSIGIQTSRIDQQKIKELLGSGLDISVVATAVGCTHGYVSQLLSQEAFANEVAEMRTVSLQANNKRDRTIDGLEDSLIEKLGVAINSGMFYKPRDLLIAFRVINSAQRRGAPAQQTAITNNVVVNLQLPQRTVEKFTISQTGEVIGVNEQTLQTMPAHELLRNLSSSKVKGDGDRYERVSRYLPSANSPATISAECQDAGS